jgi:hypothetical protein
MNTKHTPTPEIVLKKLKAYEPVSGPEFAFIVRAVNNHTELLDLLKWLDRTGGLGLDVHRIIRQAIVKAEGVANAPTADAKGE